MIGQGEMGHYAIRSDSVAEKFLMAVETSADPVLRKSLSAPAGSYIAGRRGKPVALTAVGMFLSNVAQEIRHALPARHADLFATGLEACRAQQQWDDSWIMHCRDADGGTVQFRSTAIVLAAGAEQPRSRLYAEEIAGVPLLPRFADKTIQSSEFLGLRADAAIAALVGERSVRTIAIVGGSHSAMSSAVVSLRKTLRGLAACQTVTVLHRGPLRLTYSSTTAACSDGYYAFSAQDVCPKTGRVYPLAGFRNDSRELLRHHWQLGGLPPEDRLRLFRLEPSTHDEANKLLEGADLIVAALGYRPRALPLFDRNGAQFPLHSELGTAPLVDGQCRVLGATGREIPGIFGLGLAAGYPLAGVHGEPSFKGQANGLALWQGEVGAQLVNNVLEFIRARRWCDDSVG